MFALNSVLLKHSNSVQEKGIISQTGFSCTYFRVVVCGLRWTNNC